MSRQRQKTFSFQPSTATDVDQVNAVFAENYKQSAGRIRPQANKLFRHVVQVEDLIDQGSALGLDFGEMLLKLQQTLGDPTYSGDLVILGSFNRVKQVAKKLFNSNIFTGKEFGHDFSIVAIRLGTLAQVLQDLEDNIARAKGYDPSDARRQAPGNVSVPSDIKQQEGLGDLFTYDKARKGETPRDEKATLKTLRAVKKRVQTMFLGARRLQNISPFKGNIQSKYTALANDLNTIEDFQLELTTEKQKMFNIKEGKADLGITVVEKKKNRFDAIFEAAFGRNLSKEFTVGTEKNMRDYFLNKVDIGDIRGGPETLNNKITKDLSEMLVGKTPKKSKTKSKTKPKKVTLAKRTRKNKVAISAQRAKAGADYARRALAVAAIQRRSDKKESGNSSDFRALSELRTKIQARLPARVRENMGPPALTNRTSRFSNSVHLKQLRRTAAGISGEYSYMLSPYETFENTGPKKWKTSYNPKPLITKSIRQLALEIANERFTRGNRT
tara:strand:+ start:1588 stop:3084 length:1497 start_codon:yes stop_codon:yes gene_type:complete